MKNKVVLLIIIEIILQIAAQAVVPWVGENMFRGFAVIVIEVIPVLGILRYVGVHSNCNMVIKIIARILFALFVVVLSSIAIIMFISPDSLTFNVK